MPRAGIHSGRGLQRGCLGANGSCGHSLHRSLSGGISLLPPAYRAPLARHRRNSVTSLCHIPSTHSKAATVAPSQPLWARLGLRIPGR